MKAAPHPVVVDGAGRSSPALCDARTLERLFPPPPADRGGRATVAGVVTMVPRGGRGLLLLRSDAASIGVGPRTSRHRRRARQPRKDGVRVRRPARCAGRIRRSRELHRMRDPLLLRTHGGRHGPAGSSAGSSSRHVVDDAAPRAGRGLHAAPRRRGTSAHPRVASTSGGGTRRRHFLRGRVWTIPQRPHDHACTRTPRTRRSPPKPREKVARVSVSHA